MVINTTKTQSAIDPAPITRSPPANHPAVYHVQHRHQDKFLQVRTRYIISQDQLQIPIFAIIHFFSIDVRTYIDSALVPFGNLLIRTKLMSAGNALTYNLWFWIVTKPAIMNYFQNGASNTKYVNIYGIYFRSRNITPRCFNLFVNSGPSFIRIFAFALVNPVSHSRLPQ